MANGHGGYRQPTNPSPVSGPGALSQRTDGPLHAPIPGSPDPMQQGQALGPDPSQLTPLGAPSQRPDEPVFAGMPGGPGGGSSVPMTASGLTPDEQARVRSYLPVLIFQASQDSASPQFKQFVRQLRGEVG